MPKLRNNVAANFAGQAWTALIGVLFLPVYVRLLGLEAYGLIGVYISMQALLFVLDLGLSATLNRELARQVRADSHAESGSTGDLVRTLEWLIWPLCGFIALLVALASHAIAAHWLHPVTFPQQRVARAVTLMGFAIAAQWPCAFYSGGLNGLERQVSLNLANIVFATLRWVAVIPVLRWLGPSIEVYLGWQLAVAIVQTAAMRSMLMRALPRQAQRVAFRLGILHDVRGFASGMFVVAALSFVLVQADRMVLSRLLPLDQFGRYVLVATVAATLSRVFNPFFAALYPRYSRLVALGDHTRLTALYHMSNQFLAVGVASVASVLAFFSEDVLRLWTHDANLAAAGAPVLSVLVVGTALNGLMNLPYALQLAHGWTRLTLFQNLLAVVLVVPATVVLAQRFGALGAASVWASLNFIYFAVGIPIMHRKLLRHEMKAWYLRDIFPAAISAITIAGTARLCVRFIADNPSGLLTLASISIATLSASAASSSATRRVIRRVIASLKRRLGA